MCGRECRRTERYGGTARGARACGGTRVTAVTSLASDAAGRAGGRLSDLVMTLNARPAPVVPGPRAAPPHDAGALSMPAGAMPSAAFMGGTDVPQELSNGSPGGLTCDFATDSLERL